VIRRLPAARIFQKPGDFQPAESDALPLSNSNPAIAPLDQRSAIEAVPSIDAGTVNSTKTQPPPPVFSATPVGFRSSVSTFDDFCLRKVHDGAIKRFFVRSPASRLRLPPVNPLPSGLWGVGAGIEPGLDLHPPSMERYPPCAFPKDRAQP